MAPNVRPFEERMYYAQSKVDYFAHPENYRIAPFQIFGNLYYVGDQDACPYLIDTDDGLILIDTGYGHETHFLIENIETLGFRVEDIKIIIHSHGHYDHFGGTEEIKRRSGATVYMSQVDTQLLREMPERALCHHSPIPGATIPWPDVEVQDGDHIRLGNTDITCVLSPGHTFGTLSFFFDVTDGKKKLRVGYWGGTGVLTMYKAYCAWYHLPANKCDAMLDTIEKLRTEHVDISIGNHAGQCAMVKKRQQALDNPGTNPYIDDTYWHQFLEKVEKNCREMIRLGY